MGAVSTRPADAPEAPDGLRNTALLTLATYGIKLLGLGKVLVVARLLEPRGYGLLGIVTMVAGYAALLDGGALHGLNLLAPELRGQQRHEEERRVVRHFAALRLAATFCWVVGVAVYVLWSWPRASAVMRPVLWTLVPAVAFVTLQRGFEVVLQIQLRFDHYVVAALVGAIGDFVLVAGGALKWGVPGALVGMVVAAAIETGVLFYLGRDLQLHRPLWPDRREAWRLFGPGLLLTLIFVCEYLLINLDQLVIALVLGPAALGLYSLAQTAGTLLLIIPQSRATILTPVVIERVARANATGRGLDDIFALLTRTAHGQADLVALPCGLAFALAPWAFSVFLPKYAGSVLPLQLVALGVFFYGIAKASLSSFLVAINRATETLYALVPCTLFNLALDLVLLRLGWGLVGVATGSLVTYALYLVVSAVVAYRHFQRPAVWYVRYLARILAPWAIMTAIVVGGDRAAAWLGRPASLAIALPTCLLLVVTLGPFAWRGIRSLRASGDAT